MDYGGFERDRNTLKYRCPARYSGITCEGREQCPVADAVRIKLEEDRRVFTPVARSSYDWQELRRAQRSGAGQQPVGRRLRVRSSVHPRTDQDAAAHDDGVDDHAGDGPGAHPDRSAREPAESGQTRLSGDHSPVTTRNPIPQSAPRDRSVLSCPPSHGWALITALGPPPAHSIWPLLNASKSSDDAGRTPIAFRAPHPSFNCPENRYSAISSGRDELARLELSNYHDRLANVARRFIRSVRRLR